MKIDESNFEKRIPVFIKLGFAEESISPLRKYLEILSAANEELNLVSRKMTFAELIDNHVIDCMLGLSHFPYQKNCVADLGSGGGLPGIIFALAFPQIRFRFYEKSALKQKFLNQCCEIASNVEIRGLINSDLVGSDLVMARAFKSIAVTLEMTSGYYKKNGEYFLFKGKKEKIEEEISEAEIKFPQFVTKIETLHSPVLEVERNVVRININDF
jgi:16S rRNA (guanine527-N7)-methyltransferase